MKTLPAEVLLCGIDEAGRGPWAGPVCAGAVILSRDNPISGLADSKALTHLRREALVPLIEQNSLAWALGWASVEEIDALNIRRATHLAMQRAVAALKVTPTFCLVDGNDAPDLPGNVRTLVKGDRLEAAISAASILAKVARDRLMRGLEADFPGYGFARHKGYGTAAHAEALTQLGPCQHHRLSFRPVAMAAGKALQEQALS